MAAIGSIEIDPSSRFVYFGLLNVDRLSAFTIDTATGLLARGTAPSDVVSRDNPYALAITKGTAAVTVRPKFAYVANAGSDDISGYRVDVASGALTALASGPFAAGDGSPQRPKREHAAGDEGVRRVVDVAAEVDVARLAVADVPL